MVVEEKKKNTLRNVLMLVVALGLGGIGVFVSKGYIENAISQATDVPVKNEPMVELVVTSRNMLRGETITPDTLSLRSFPKKYADSNAVTEANHQIAIGQRLAFDIDGGTSLLWAHLEGGKSPTFSGRVKEGYRAITISVDTNNSISGFLQPTDKVDLMLTYASKDSRGKMSKEIKPIIQNLPVLATGKVTDVDKSGNSTSQTYSTITVEVTPDDAKKIILAKTLGSISAVLRNPDDFVPDSKTPISVDDILGRKAVVKKKIWKRKPGIEYIIGGV